MHHQLTEIYTYVLYIRTYVQTSLFCTGRYVCVQLKQTLAWYKLISVNNNKALNGNVLNISNIYY